MFWVEDVLCNKNMVPQVVAAPILCHCPISKGRTTTSRFMLFLCDASQSVYATTREMVESQMVMPMVVCSLKKG